MVRIFVWPPAKLPDEEGVLITYVGHVAFQTDKYYVSFWPQDGKRRDFSALNGVPADLVINYEFDVEMEGERDPKIYDITHYASDAAVNRQIDKFLRHNGIDLIAVAHATATKEFVSLPKTKYSFKPELIRDHSQGDEWFDEPQSCVSFCFNVIEMASSEQIFHVDVLSFFGTDYRVPWFEERIVEQCWMNKPPGLNLFSILLILCWIFLSSVSMSTTWFPELFLVRWFYLCLNIFLSYYYFMPRFGIATFTFFVSFFSALFLYLSSWVIYYMEIEYQWMQRLSMAFINPTIATSHILHVLITSNIMLIIASEIYANLPARIRQLTSNHFINYLIIWIFLVLVTLLSVGKFAHTIRKNILNSYFHSSLIPK